MGKEQRQVINVNRGEVNSVADWLAEEWPLTLVVNGKQYITLLTTPEHLDELAVGFALGDGLLNGREDLVSVSVSSDRRQVKLALKGEVDLVSRLAVTRVLTTGCGKGSRFYRAVDSLKQHEVTGGRVLSPERLTELMREFNGSSPLFAETGAVHAAALVRDEIEVLREDVARHNAIDKLAGYLTLNNKQGKDYVLLSSGRISSEFVLKATRMGVGTIVSRSAPTALAVDLATDLGVTVVGFVRGRRFNIYSHSWRVEGFK